MDDWRTLNDWVTGHNQPNGRNSCKGLFFDIVRDIGSPNFRVDFSIGDGEYTFEGNINGNCHTIYVNILTFQNKSNGLFSEVSG
jgi:hypothetical protein